MTPRAIAALGACLILLGIGCGQRPAPVPVPPPPKPITCPDYCGAVCDGKPVPAMPAECPMPMCACKTPVQ